MSEKPSAEDLLKSLEASMRGEPLQSLCDSCIKDCKKSTEKWTLIRCKDYVSESETNSSHFTNAREEET